VTCALRRWAALRRSLVLLRSVLSAVALSAVAVTLGGCTGDDSAAPDAGAAEAAPSAASGASAVAARGCDRCHQPSDPREGVLAGQTTALPGSHAYGSNLTPDPDTGMDAWEAGTIAQAVLVGQGSDGGPLCPQMPRYAEAGMEQPEALDIAAYLQSLAPVRHPIPPSVCPALRPRARD